MDKLLLQYKTSRSQQQQQEQESAEAAHTEQTNTRPAGSAIDSADAQQVLQQAAAQVRHGLQLLLCISVSDFACGL
jgi:hypothetical protein